MWKSIIESYFFRINIRHNKIDIEEKQSWWLINSKTSNWSEAEKNKKRENKCTKNVIWNKVAEIRYRNRIRKDHKVKIKFKMYCW